MTVRGRKPSLDVDGLRARRTARAVEGQRLRSHDGVGNGELSLAEWQSILRAWGGRCAYCGRQSTGEGRDVIHIDHVEPLRRGGRNTAENVVPACYACNASKIDLLLLEWVCRKVGLFSGRSFQHLRAV